jgi:hypothetical protein
VWTANPPRLAKRRVSNGTLLPLAHGLFACPARSRFGVVPPTDVEWFVIDLFEHVNQAATCRADVATALARALSRKAIDRHQLWEMARRSGTRATLTGFERAEGVEYAQSRLVSARN